MKIHRRNFLIASSAALLAPSKFLLGPANPRGYKEDQFRRFVLGHW